LIEDSLKILIIKQLSTIFLRVCDKLWAVSDERILGGSDVPADVLAGADEAMERKTALAAQGINLQRVIDLAADLLSMPRGTDWWPGEIRGSGEGAASDLLLGNDPTGYDHDRCGQRLEDFSADRKRSSQER